MALYAEPMTRGEAGGNSSHASKIPSSADASHATLWDDPEPSLPPSPAWLPQPHHFSPRPEPPEALGRRPAPGPSTASPEATAEADIAAAERQAPDAAAINDPFHGDWPHW